MTSSSLRPWQSTGLCKSFKSHSSPQTWGPGWKILKFLFSTILEYICAGGTWWLTSQTPETAFPYSVPLSTLSHSNRLCISWLLLLHVSEVGSQKLQGREMNPKAQILFHNHHLLKTAITCPVWLDVRHSHSWARTALTLETKLLGPCCFLILLRVFEDSKKREKKGQQKAFDQL